MNQTEQDFINEALKEFDRKFNIPKGHWYPSTYKKWFKDLLRQQQKELEIADNRWKANEKCREENIELRAELLQVIEFIDTHHKKSCKCWINELKDILTTD